MCNIAGYIGDKQAAPILIEMMKREEGFAGGCYTGIATLHKGQLHYAKLMGATDALVSKTDAMHLPGNIGFIHSRPNGGGGTDAWAHPFISNNNQMALIVNGTEGKFREKYPKEDIAKMLIDNGYAFTATTKEPIGYPKLEHDIYVHATDIMCQYIQYWQDRKLSHFQTMEKVHNDLKNEIVGLLLDVKHEDRIFITKENYPMSVAFSENEVFLASTQLAFPEDRSYRNMTQLLNNAYSEVYTDRIVTIPYAEYTLPIASRTSEYFNSIYNRCLRLLSEDYISLEALLNGISDLHPEGMLDQKYIIVYDILLELKNKDKIDFKQTIKESATGENTAPSTVMKLK